MHVFRFVILAVVLLASARAAAPARAEGFTHALFDGETLRGWTVTGCEAAVRDGALMLVEGDGLVRSNARYGDFILELEWKALRDQAWDSGIYIRAETPPEGRPWPRRYQVNLKQGDEGNLIGVAEARSTGLTRDGEWNRMRLTVRGTTAVMEINGKPAWTTDALEPGSGYIGFQSETAGGGQFLFRDIRITELGHRSLFNGSDLTGWELADDRNPACWRVAEGLLECTGEKGSWLRSAEQFGDFNLRLEYRLLPGGNSGVYVRVPADGNHHGPGAGVEVQLLDDEHQRYAGRLEPYQYTGSVYKIIPASPRTAPPAEQWNQMEIECRGQHYRVVLNGVVIVDAGEEAYPELKERNLSGFLGLQNHSENVWFRHIRVGPPLP